RSQALSHSHLAPGVSLRLCGCTGPTWPVVLVQCVHRRAFSTKLWRGRRNARGLYVDHWHLPAGHVHDIFCYPFLGEFEKVPTCSGFSGGNYRGSVRPGGCVGDHNVSTTREHVSELQRYHRHILYTGFHPNSRAIDHRGRIASWLRRSLAWTCGQLTISDR